MNKFVYTKFRHLGLTVILILIASAAFLIKNGLYIRSIIARQEMFLMGTVHPERFYFFFHFLIFLIGLFIAPPLISQELSSGTFRLAWTQSMTRTEWFNGLISRVFGFCLACFILLMLLFNWWAAPLVKLFGPYNVLYTFGISPVFHLLLCLMGGLLIGVLVKRPILAMALYFPFFAFTVFLFFLPMHIVPPLQSQWDFKGANPDLQTQYIYEVSKSFIDQDGKEINQTEVLSSCVKKEGTIYVNPDFSSCFIEKGLILVTRFQPASRFWAFQAIDISICIILSILFYFLSVFWIKEKIS